VEWSAPWATDFSPASRGVRCVGERASAAAGPVTVRPEVSSVGGKWGLGVHYSSRCHVNRLYSDYL
jgi:hypothetical protein